MRKMNLKLGQSLAIFTAQQFFWQGAILTYHIFLVNEGLGEVETRKAVHIDRPTHSLRRGPDTSRGQKLQNMFPSSLRASDMFAGVQQLISVQNNKLRSGTLLAFFGLY